MRSLGHGLNPWQGGQGTWHITSWAKTIAKPCGFWSALIVLPQHIFLISTHAQAKTYQNSVLKWSFTKTKLWLMINERITFTMSEFAKLLLTTYGNIIIITERWYANKINLFTSHAIEKRKCIKMWASSFLLTSHIRPKTETWQCLNNKMRTWKHYGAKQSAKKLSMVHSLSLYP